MEILIKDACKTIKKNQILNHVDMHLTSGKIYGFQGPNGSGKTMLMRLICGLMKPTSGSVCIDGKQLGKDIDFPPSMGLLLEGPAFLEGYTGMKNLQLLASLQGKISDEDICQALRAVGLRPDDRRTYKKYSLGMKQRLGLAAAVMEKPELLLLDEPTNALDDQGIAQSCDLIRQERQRGALVILACHDAAILEMLADEIYTIYEGNVEKKVRQ